MKTVWQDVRYGMRMLGKNPGFTLAAIVMLALGIGANTALFSAVRTVLLSSLPYKNPGQLVTLTASESTSIDPQNVSYLKTQDWRERSHAFESIALYRSFRPVLTGQKKPEMLRGGRVSANFFETLGISPIRGRGFLAEEDRPDRWHEVLLSYGYWKEAFGGTRRRGGIHDLPRPDSISSCGSASGEFQAAHLFLLLEATASLGSFGI